jgi:spore photoproduct lyase
MLTRINRILVHNEARRFSLTRRILKRLASVPTDFIASRTRLARLGKRTLVLAVNKGKFVRPFNEVGNDAYYLHHQTGCYNHCRYCYLQTYLEQPEIITVFVNQRDLRRELAQLVRNRPDRVSFYSGELTDSLQADDITEYSLFFHQVLAGLPIKAFEFRTKTDTISTLCQCRPQANITITWSLNPAVIVSQYEHGTVSLDRRLKAARHCLSQGFKIGFHIDPVIHVPDWQQQYRNLITRVFKYIKPEHISGFSIGCLRFKKGLKEGWGEQEYSKYPAFLDEFIPGQDGKYRYFKLIRQDIYLYLLRLLRKHIGLEEITICMESPDFVQDIIEKIKFHKNRKIYL